MSANGHLVIVSLKTRSVCRLMRLVPPIRLASLRFPPIVWRTRRQYFRWETAFHSSHPLNEFEIQL